MNVFKRRGTPRRKVSPAQQGSQAGVALFMVISALALMSILLAELTYSTQMNSRMSYNYIDNLKAHYMAKAGMRISLLRLRAFVQASKFFSDSNNKAMKEAIPAKLLEKIWSLPFMFPIPLPPEASNTETDAVKAFVKASSLSGSFSAIITGQSTRLNLNNLFITESAPAAQTGNAGAKTTAPAPTPAGTTGQVEALDFTQVLEPAITGLLEQKKNEDREFADSYRNVFGKDVVDAIRAYLFKDVPPSNLPGFKEITPKEAPFYSLSELHLIPGIEDDIYDLIEPMLTVYTTPGIDVNSIQKNILLALVPEMTAEEAEEIINKRDDPQVGQPFANENDFWTAVSGTTAGRSLDAIKQRFAKAGLKIITEERCFKIGVLSSVGLSTRRLEAYVIVDPSAIKPPSLLNALNSMSQPNQPSPTPPLQNTGTAGNNPASEKKATGLNLVYWRML